MPPQPPGVFSIRGLRLYFPTLEPWGYLVCSALLPFLLVYLCVNVGPGDLLASGWTACPLRPTLRQSPGQATATGILSAPLPVSASPTGLDECFLFISLVVGLPCHLMIFCQIRLCEEAQCVYLCLHLGSRFHKFLNFTYGVIVASPSTFY